MALEQPLSWYLPCILAVGVVYLVVLRNRRTKEAYLPWLNYNEAEWFPRFRARLRSTRKTKATIQLAYEKYSKASQACVFPDLGGECVILPRSSADWIIAQPDSKVSNKAAIDNILQPNYAALEPSVVHNPTHEATIRGSLTRNLASLVPDIYEEVEKASDEFWGSDGEWKDVCAYDAVMSIVARASNRVFIGGLCRNKTILSTSIKWAVLFPLTGTILRQTPRLLRPILAPVITFLNHLYARRYIRLLTPEIKKRQQALSNETKSKPNDFLQWLVDLAEDSPLESERLPRVLALRMLIVNFAAIHTSTFTVTNAVFDLVSANPTDVDEIRQEIKGALETNGGKWDKTFLQKLIKLDSAMRESARLGGFAMLNAQRRVVAAEGLNTPDGAHLPYGTLIALPTLAIHTDSALYDDSHTFKPLRFDEMRKPVSDSLKNELNTEDLKSDNTSGHRTARQNSNLISNANLSFVSLSTTYHPFGLGKHACPGRFFAANELKLVLAHLLLNYEIQHQPVRASSQYIGTAVLPPTKATIRLRKIKT